MIKVIGQKKNLFLNVKLYFPIGMKKRKEKGTFVPIIRGFQG